MFRILINFDYKSFHRLAGSNCISFDYFDNLGKPDERENRSELEYRDLTLRLRSLNLLSTRTTSPANDAI